MNDLLIITHSCQSDEDSGRNAGVRDTWLKEWGHLFDHKFTFGSETSPSSASYWALPFRTQFACRYALEHDDPRFFSTDQNIDFFKYDQPGCWDDGKMTVHLGRGTGHFNPDWMRSCHRSFIKAFYTDRS